MSNEEIKSKLLAAGVKNLKDFGYPHVTTENILTDEVYSEFFKSMLKENKGQSTRQVDTVMEGLIKQIDNPIPKP